MAEQKLLTRREVNQALSHLQGMKRDHQNQHAAYDMAETVLQTTLASMDLLEQHDRLKDETQTLDTRRVQLEQSVRALQDQANNLDDDIRAARAAGKLKSLIEERERTLAEREAKITEVTAEYARHQLALDDLRARLGMGGNS